MKTNHLTQLYCDNKLLQEHRVKHSDDFSRQNTKSWSWSSLRLSLVSLLSTCSTTSTHDQHRHVPVSLLSAHTELFSSSGGGGGYSTTSRSLSMQEKEEETGLKLAHGGRGEERKRRGGRALIIYEAGRAALTYFCTLKAEQYSKISNNY